LGGFSHRIYVTLDLCSYRIKRFRLYITYKIKIKSLESAIPLICSMQLRVHARKRRVKRRPDTCRLVLFSYTRHCCFSKTSVRRITGLQSLRLQSRLKNHIQACAMRIYKHVFGSSACRKTVRSKNEKRFEYSIRYRIFHVNLFLETRKEKKMIILLFTRNFRSKSIVLDTKELKCTTNEIISLRTLDSC